MLEPLDDLSIGEYESYQVNDGRYNYKIGRENPAFRSSIISSKNEDETLASTQYNHPYEAVRRRRTNQQSTNGIEDIRMEMPSRVISRKAGRYGHGTLKSMPSHYGTYSRYMLQQNLSEQSSDTANEIDIIFSALADEDGDISNDKIRDLACDMSTKKQLRYRVSVHREKQKSKKVGAFQLWRYKMAMNRKQFTQGIKRRIHSPELWGGYLKQVEGNFGSGVSSYFTFLRGLFFLSIPSFILNFAFISLPQLLDLPSRTDTNVSFTGEELITGANWLTETILYYGFYTNSTIEVIPGAVYKMPLAYLLATAGYFFLCLLWVTRATATAFRHSYIEASVTYTNFIGKVFCVWDYGITSGSVAKLQRKTIATDLKEVLAERIRADERSSLETKCKLFLLRLFAWSLYLALAGGSMALIYYVNKLLLGELHKLLEGVEVLPDILLALIVSTINLLMPILINVLTHYERYTNPRHELYVAVFRNYLLKMGLLAVICAFWLDDSLQDGNDKTNITVDCWETELGQEVYRLVVIDFLFSIIFLTFFAEFIRNISATHCFKSLKKAEFAIADNVLDLIYGQTLCWIGVFFSPLLSLIVIIKYFFFFYIKQISVMQNCRPPKRKWRAAHSRTLFNGLLLLSFLLSACFLGYVVFRETPSEECGPYRGLSSMYDVVISEFDILGSNPESEWFEVILEVLVNVWFLYGVVVTLIILIILRRSSAKGYEHFANALRRQINLEGQDKQLLLKWLQTASNQTDGPGGGDQHKLPILHQRRGTRTSTKQKSGNIHQAEVYNVAGGDASAFVDTPVYEAAIDYNRQEANETAPKLPKTNGHQEEYLTYPYPYNENQDARLGAAATSYHSYYETYEGDQYSDSSDREYEQPSAMQLALAAKAESQANTNSNSNWAFGNINRGYEH